MANNSGKPYVAPESGKVLLVNPNPPDREMVNLEDLSISVELETFRKGRSIITTIKDLTNVTNDNNNSKKVSFINGSKVDGKNSLTTNYTELNTEFNAKNKDLEGLGITSINIDFNSSFAPMISIEFIDIRGSSILEQGSNGIYSVFFELPYPIFKLTVKGYYGQAVTYFLHLTNWSAAFNSQTGNFEIHCEFIGYTYAFLTDMLMGYLRGIVETTAGLAKFKELKGGREDIITINELIVKVAQINESVNKLKGNNETVKQLAAARQAGVLINTLSDKFDDFIKGIIGINGSSDDPNSNYINTYQLALNDASVYSILIPKYDITKDSEYVSQEDSLNIGLQELITEINIKIDEPNKLKTDLFVVNRGDKITNGINVYPNYSYTADNFNKELVPANIVSSNINNTEIGEYVKTNLPIVNIGDLRIYDFDNSTKEIKRLRDFIKQQIFELDKSVTQIIKRRINTDFGFTPTVKNIIEIFTIHVEVFIQCLKEISVKAENEHKTDILKRLLSDKNNKSVISDSNTDYIYPWPLYATEKNGSVVETFIGTVAPNIPEVLFINELINGMIRASQIEENALQSILSKSSNWYPVTLYDNQFITPSTVVNPYTSVGAEGKLNEIVRLVGLRACAFLTYSNGTKHINNLNLLKPSDIEISLMARLEADNLWSMMIGAIDSNNGQLRQQLKTLANQGSEAASKTIITALLTGNLEGNKDAFLLPDGTKSIISNVTSISSVTFASGGAVDTAPVNSTETINNNYKYSYLKLNVGTSKVPVIPIGGTDLTFLSTNFNSTFFNADKTSKELKNMSTDLTLLSVDKVNGVDYVRFIEESDYVYDAGEYPNYASKIFTDLSVADNLSSNLIRTGDGYEGLSFFNGTLKQQEFFNHNNKEYTAGNGLVYLDFYSEGGPSKTGLLTAIKKNVSPLEKESDSKYKKLSKNDNPNAIEFIVEAADVNKYFRDESEGNKLVSFLVGDKENTIEDFVFLGFRNSSGSFHTKLSLFGSEFYYRQVSENSKAFLFLSSIGFKTTIHEEANIITSLFNQRSGFIKAPKAWVYYIGSILWREKQSTDPIVWFINKITKQTFRPLNELNYTGFDGEFTDTNYILINTPFLRGTNLTPPKKTQLLSSNLTPEDGPLIFTDDRNNYINISDTLVDKLPNNVKELFINSFLDWVKEDTKTIGSWKSIKIELEIYNKSISSWDNTWDSFTQQVSDVYVNNNITYINNNFINIDNYDIITPIIASDSEFVTKNYFLNLNENALIISGVKSFLNETIIIANTTPTIWGAQNKYDFVIPETSMIRYFTEFFTEINNKYKEDAKDTNKKEIEQKIFNSIDDDNINLNMYRNIKAIYDKWIAGVDNIITLCGVNSENKTNSHLIDSFRFIDKSFKDIGDDFLLNPSSIMNYLSDNFNQSFYDITGRILADNNFDFIALPTFVNIRSAGELEKMFTATPTNSALESKGPTFICMYANRANKLDLGGESNFTDSGFNFKLDSSNTVTAPASFNNAATVVPVFLVNYGEANQSMFKDLRLNQKEFSETDESLTIIDNLTKANTLNNRASVGQNLFNIYSVRSYSCEIESLGNAMIQPMMYFQLNNIPMFRGAYLITRVSHKIVPNHMTTTFKGVRIASSGPPLVDEQTLYLNLIGELAETNTTGVVLVDNTVPTTARDVPPEVVLELNFGNPVLSPFTITSPLGKRRGKEHRGIDIGVKYGSDVITIANGKIKNIRLREEGFGLHLIIEHAIFDKKVWRSLYAHLSDIDKNILDLTKLTDIEKNNLINGGINTSIDVIEGQILGKSGGIKGEKGKQILGKDFAGDTRGPHLHFEIRAEDLNSKGGYNKVGYGDFYNNETVKDPQMLIKDCILGTSKYGDKIKPND